MFGLTSILIDKLFNDSYTGI